MIRCLIIDDEPFARNLLADYAAKVPYLKIEASFSSAIDALPVLQKNNIDLLFLDIQMPEITGIDFLKALDHKPHVIFTTAFAEYALEGYELNVIDYLLKPFDFARFFRATEKVKKFIQPTEIQASSTNEPEAIKPYIFLKEGTSLIKLKHEDILYIKGLKDYVRVMTKSKEYIMLYTFKELLKELPKDQFIRIHNSFIVNTTHIEVIEKNSIIIAGEQIPIGNTFKSNMDSILK